MDKVSAAREAGYSDEEILEYLSSKDSQFKQKAAKASEAGYKPAEILEFVQTSERPSKIRSLLSAPLKGALKTGLGFNPLQPPGPVSKKAGEKIFERLLPTLPEHKVLERAGKIAPYALLGGGGALPAIAEIGAGALGGQLAEESGAGALGQDIAEAVGMGAGGVASGLGKFAKSLGSKRIVATKAQQPKVDFLRSKGFTERQIVPLMKDETKLNKILNRLSYKGRQAEKLQRSIQEKVGDQYDILRETGKQKFLPNREAGVFDDKLFEVYDKIPKRYQRLIQNDLDDLRNTGASFSSLIDFWQGLNATTKGVQGGKAVINKFKEPIFQAMEKIDPVDAQSFKYLNEFYSKGKKFLQRLQPSHLEKWVSLGKLGSLIGGVATLNINSLKGLMGAQAAQLALRELALNPRLQNLHLKLLQAYSKNDINMAKKIYDAMAKELPSLRPQKVESQESQ